MQSSYAAERPADAGTAPPMTSWVGVLSFAAIMMLVLGGFQILEGVTTLAHQEAFLSLANGVVELDYQTWGWSHVILGTVTVATGIGVFLGQTWARVVGVIITAGAALTHFSFLAVAPLWCSILICVEVVVIYALAVHGRDVRSKP
ncbi:hypothetical protein AB0M02_14465 [Actinoplanes sp. NPDC051861]|uniref:DUF7144 family membrane protein n=1 Tax=Actinoplanes sp. NPDC051861 TaxID=3155170 RepID=UPI00341E9078